MIFFAKNNIPTTHVARFDGKGRVAGMHPFSLDQRPEKSRFRMIGHMTLEPHSSIGFHTHHNDEEIYIAVSGDAVFIDNDGSCHPVKAGDVMLTRQGEAHGLENNSDQPFYFIGVVVD